MADAHATCALAITPEMLSAWRDRQVKATTDLELDRHVPGCAACQRELGHFDLVAHALLRQRELEPGNRIWRGVQAQITRSPRARMAVNTRGFLSGIGGVLVVVLLGVLFARVLGGTGTHNVPTATAVASASPVATATASATALPTASGSPTTTAVTIAQAWGANAATQTLTTPSDATHTFQATNITADGTKLLGDTFTFASPPSNNQGPSAAQAGILDIATHNFTDIGVIPPTLGLFDTPSCCLTDGRFLVAEDSSQPGATGASGHVRIWSYDTQTRQSAHIVATSQQFQEIYTTGFDHGTLVMNTDTGIQVEDLTTLHVTTITPSGGNPAVGYIASFTWPYLAYGIANETAAGTTSTLSIYDVTTKTVVLSLPNATDAVITGDTLFYTVPATTSATLFELDRFTTPGAQPQRLATYATSATSNPKLLAANGRIVLIAKYDGGYDLAWDRAERQFVQLALTATGEPPAVALSGNLLLITQASSAYAAQRVAIYDTSHLPQLGQ